MFAFSKSGFNLSACVCAHPVDDVVDESDDNEEMDADTENDTENEDDEKDQFSLVNSSAAFVRIHNVEQIFFRRPRFIRDQRFYAPIKVAMSIIKLPH